MGKENAFLVWGVQEGIPGRAAFSDGGGERVCAVSGLCVAEKCAGELWWERRAAASSH